jgi:endoglucanase/cellulose 1,4-beta-cellobiosidase
MAAHRQTMRRLATAALAAALGFAALLLPGTGAIAAPAPAVIAPPLPPGPPTDLTVTGVTSTSVTLSWTASTPGCCPVAGYEIAYKQTYSDIFSLATVGAVTTATITHLAPAHQYHFVVTVRDDQGNRSTAPVIDAVTPAADTGDITPPTWVGALTVSDVTATSARLHWSPATDDTGVTGYDVYLFDQYLISTRLAALTGTSYTVPLGSGHNEFYVRARDAAGNVSLASNSVVVAPATLSCRVTFAVASQWNTGFVAWITITNTGTTTINGWVLTFTFPGDQVVTGSWNGTYSQTGRAVTIHSTPWNAVIQPGASVQTGFQATSTATNNTPTDFKLNGVPCTR